MRLPVLDDVADVTRADPERFGGDHRGLRGDQRVHECQHEVAFSGIAGRQAEFGGAALAHPSARGIGLPLAQVVPLQLLSYHLAEQAGFEPGAFRAVSKVTEIE